MRRTRQSMIAALAAALAALVVLSVPAGAQDSSSGGASALRIGWASTPGTMNPFVGQDEEDYNVWALNWDLLVNFSPEDLSPAPGIAESWKVSDDRKTTTFKLDPDAVWSDGEPITSADVKWSLEVLGSEGLLFTNYTSNVTSIKTPDDYTVVVETRRPDARIIGGLFIYILPEHIWGKVPIKDLNGNYQPELPLVGSGPYVVSEFERGRIIRMERNPNFSGPEPAFDEVQFITYGNQDAVERALQLGEVDMVMEVQSATFESLGEEPNIDTARSPQPAYTQLGFNLCPEELCPDAEFNPAVQDLEVRQALAYAIDRNRINEIAGRGTSFVADGILPTFYKSFYETPEQTYPYDPELANQILDDAGWVLNDDGVRTKDGEELSFNLYVRSESAYNTQAAKLVAEQAADIGVEFDVQVVSTDKMYDVTVNFVDGKPAPTFDTFIWGWGGDPYDPSLLLSLFLTSEVGGLSDSFYANPEYDRLFEEQSGAFDVEERRAIIQEMVAITQRDLPYIVLTYDPNLQAYRTDTVANVEPACPAETGDILCEQTGYEPLLSITPAAGGGSSNGGGQSPGLAVVAALVFGIGGWLLGSRTSRRRENEPLELDA
jgi:peptide/nickel transport system substrate-binding protein